MSNADKLTLAYIERGLEPRNVPIRTTCPCCFDRDDNHMRGCLLNPATLEERTALWMTYAQLLSQASLDIMIACTDREEAFMEWIDGELSVANWYLTDEEYFFAVDSTI